MILSVIGTLGTVCKGLKNGLKENHPNYSLAKISQNIEKSPGDLRRLAVTQTPVKVNVGVKNSQ